MIKLSRNVISKCLSHRHWSSDIQASPLTVFSGIQPTGEIHLGNYLGAIALWKNLIQKQDHQCIFSVVDLHAITVRQDPQILNKQIYGLVATLIATGIDTNKCILFKQSDISAHGQLCWILGCQLTSAKLTAFPQYKEKTQHMKEAPLGLFLYPVLQAADILLYRTHCVPVGDDQIPHLFLAQTVAQKFNSRYGQLFPVPKQMMLPLASKIKSLRDPNKKMSKSDDNAKSRISLLDSDDDIRLKLKKALTDCNSNVTYDPEHRPAVSNLIVLEHLINQTPIDKIVKECKSITTAQYKQRLAEILVEHIKPIRTQTLNLLNDKPYLDRILEQGANKAKQIAEATLDQVCTQIGFR